MRRHALDAHKRLLLVWKISEGVLEATWTEGELLPQEMRDLTVEHPATDDDVEVRKLNNILDIIFK